MFSSYGVGQYSGSAATEAHLFMAPRTYRADGSTRGVIYLLGAGSVASSSIGSVINQYTASGYPCLSVDAASTPSQATWANAASIARMTDAFNYLTGTWGAKTGKVGLSGVSHGSLTCLAWAVANPTKVAWLYLALPANDVQDIHDNRSAGLAGVGLSPTSIETAYGGLTAYNAAMPASNPARSAANLAGLPARIVYSSNDPIVDISTVTALASAIGSSCTLVNTGANGHSTGGYVAGPADYQFVQANS